MKAVSIMQPWASLIAVGAKSIETRSWSTRYRGPIAIHSSKRIPPKVARDMRSDPELQGILFRYGIELSALPLGCVVATANLINCRPTHLLLDEISTQEYLLGDYAWDRFGWVLEDVQPLVEPVPVRGNLGLWEWDAAIDEFDQRESEATDAVE